MMDSAQRPFGEREERTAKERERMESLEKTHLANLLQSESGKWLLGDILNTFEVELHRRPKGHNSEDSYHRGIQDHAMKYRDLIVKHFTDRALVELKGSR